MKKLSVIIPVYNVAEYLAECLTSVCNQTLTDIEIICVNDGSTDNSGDILQDFAKQDTRIQIINQENAGLSAARNTGLKYATGEYITFLDSDDWIALDYYETLYKSAKENDADIAVGNVMCYYSDSHMALEYTFRYSFAAGKKLLLDSYDKKDILQSCAVWNKIYKRELIVDNNLQFYHGKMVEDFPFTFMAVALANKIACCPFTFLFYRQRQTSIMKDPTKQIRNTWDVLDNYNTLLTELNASNVITKNYFKSNLGIFAVKNLLSWSRKIPKIQRKKYLRDVINFIQQFETFDIPEFEIYWRLLCNTMQSNRLNKLFNIQYSFHKISVSCLGLPILKIKNTNDNLIKYYLFNLLACYKIEYKQNKRFHYLFGFKLFAHIPKIKLHFDTKLQKLQLDNSRILEELQRIQNFSFIPNAGNLGDMLIADSTLQFFDDNSVQFSMYKPDTNPHNVVYGGGGIWTAAYKDYWTRYLPVFSQAEHVVILPSSFNNCPELIDILDERFIIFCREETSYNYLKSANTRAKIILDHDMALRCPATRQNRSYRKNAQHVGIENKLKDVSVPKIAYFMRADCESSGKYKTDLDVSELTWGLETSSKDWISFCATLMLYVVNQAEIVITDRLHVAIAGLLLGKEVYMLDNTYGKLSAVYNHSMKQFKNIHFCTELPDFAPKND